MLDLKDLDERRAGALAMLHRYFGDHFKVGIGYNFTDSSEDLTDLSYGHHDFFFNALGTFWRLSRTRGRSHNARRAGRDFRPEVRDPWQERHGLAINSIG